MVVDLAGQPRFFIRAAVGLSIDRVMGKAIDRAVSIRINIAIDFFEIVLIVGDNKSLKVLDCQYRLLSIFFFRIAFS